MGGCTQRGCCYSVRLVYCIVVSGEVLGGGGGGGGGGGARSQEVGGVENCT